MRRRSLVLVLCPLVAILIHLPTLGHEFVFDDRGVIVHNPLMQDARSIPRLLVSPYWSGEGREAGIYRPLTSLSLALNRAVAGGMKAGWFHLVNVLLHGAATLLVTLLALEILSSTLPAVAAGLLFAVHPVHVEAIAGIVGRAEILAACGVLLCLRLHRRALGAAGGGGASLMMPAAWLAAFFGVMAKESAIVAPLLCALADLAFPADPSPARARRARLYAGYGAAIGAAILARVLVLGSPAAAAAIPFVDNPAAVAGPLAGRLTALGVVARYAGLLVLPHRLSADYSFDQIPVIRSPLEPAALFGLLLVALTLGAGLLLLRRRPACGFALLFVAVSGAPTSNLVFFIGTLLAERLMYLPSVGLCLLFGCVVERVTRPATERAVAGACLLVLALAMARTWTRLPDWSDDFALYRSAATVSPRSARIRYNLGNVHLRRGEYAEAEAAYRLALSIHPGFDDARSNLGLALLHLGRPREALDLLRSAAERAPDHAGVAVNLGLAYRALGHADLAVAEYARALEIDPRSARAWNNLGALDLARGDLPAAVERLERAVRLDPRTAIYRINLADALVAAGRAGEAQEQFEAAHRIAPDMPEAHRGLGEAALARGDRDGAEREFRIALDGDPTSARAANFLGFLLAQRGDARGAAGMYEIAVRLDPTLHDAHRSLGLLYAQRLDDPDRAARHLATSLEIAPEQPEADRLRALLRTLKR